MSFMSLDGVTSFLSLKYVTILCKRMRRSLSIGRSEEFSSAMAESWKKMKTSNVFSLFIVC